MKHLLHLALILSPSSILCMSFKNEDFQDFPQHSLIFTMFSIDVSSFLSLLDLCMCACVRACVCVWGGRERERERTFRQNSLHKLLALKHKLFTYKKKYILFPFRSC